MAVFVHRNSCLFGELSVSWLYNSHEMMKSVSPCFVFVSFTEPVRWFDVIGKPKPYQ